MPKFKKRQKQRLTKLVIAIVVVVAGLSTALTFADPCDPATESCHGSTTENSKTSDVSASDSASGKTTPADDCAANPTKVGCPDNVGKPKEPLGTDCDGKTTQDCLTDCKAVPFICNVVQPIVNTLSALAMLVIVGMIILGGVRYAAAGDKPEAMGAAKKHIVQALTALLVFLLLFAFVQYLIPGGIFK